MLINRRCQIKRIKIDESEQWSSDNVNNELHKKAIPAKLNRQRRSVAAAIGIFLFVSAFTSTLSYTIAEVVANNRIQTVKQTLKSTQNITIDLFNKSKIIYVDHEERLSVIEQVLQIYEYSYQSTQKAEKLRNVIFARFMGTATALLEREFHHSLVDQVKEDFKGADPDTFSKKTL